jgi:aldose 1-epimerase
MGSIDGFESVRIISPGGTVAAEFVPDANMLCHSLTRGGAELLHQGHGVRAYAERGRTMGVPLLYPWANRLARPEYEAAGRRVRLPAPDGRYPVDDNGLPIHGALPGLLRWAPTDTGDTDRIRARLRWSAPELLELFPFVHEVQCEARVDDGALHVATTVAATGEDPVPVSFGYHPYLHPPGGVARADWTVELGASERVVLDARMIPAGATEPLGARTFTLGDQSWDDGLSGLTTPPVFTVAARDQVMTVTFDAGYTVAQVFAPHGQDFICFEPMTAPTNALIDGRGLVVVAPGAEFRAAFTVAVPDN